MQPEPSEFDIEYCDDDIETDDENNTHEVFSKKLYENLCCGGFFGRLTPEPDQNDLYDSKDTVENALTCRCHKETSVLSKVCHGDLYFLGLLWISAMKTALFGFDVFPALQAASPAPTAEKPPKMPYKELPLYDTPHKDYRESKEASVPLCPEAKQNLLQDSLLPTVSTYRKKVSEAYYQNKCVARNFLIDQGKHVEKKYIDFVNFMRDSNNFPYRIGAVALTSLIGLRMGWRGGIPRKMFFTGLGALAGGALAFPTETDLAFRSVAFHTGNVFLKFYNIFYGTCASMPTQKPCPEPVKERLICKTADSMIPEKTLPCPSDPPKK